MSEHQIPVFEPLVTFCQENFDCERGPAAAYFELPQIGLDPVRVIYVVYAIEGPTYEACETWMIDKVFRPLVQKAGIDARLYWRLPEMFDITPYRDVIRLRTRLAVLNKDLELCQIPEAIKPEGTACPRVSDE